MYKLEEVRYDFYFLDIFWDIIKDDKGKVIGEVYLVFLREKLEWIKLRKKVCSYY